MRTVEDGVKGSKVTALLEWQTCDTDAEWHTSALSTLTTATLQAQVTRRPNWVTKHWRLGVALVIILATIGGLTWIVAQRGVDQIEAELRDSVELDLRTTATDGSQEIPKRSTAVQLDSARAPTSTVQLIALPGETAIVQFVTQLAPDQPTLRQTRFYRQTAEGWLHTKPDAKLWGSPRRLESSHFIFQFRQNDAQVVAAVAPQIDNIYTELQRNFGLTPNGEKLVIEVTVEQITGATLIRQWKRDPLVVPSPAIYLAPVELSDSAILAQSIVLPLIEYMGNRAIEDYAIPPSWRPLLRGMRLWQLWDLNMPLSHWHHDIVNALYMQIPTADHRRRFVMPEPYSELCAMHALWVPSPTMVGIPFECSISDEDTWVAMPWLALRPRTHLDQLGIPLNGYELISGVEVEPFGGTKVATVATLLEYIVAAYGYEQLPVLLTGMARYDDWKTLVPAVFGISAADFEAGWRSYLAKLYNVSLDD